VPETVSIDGSFGKGGGQIIRTSVSLAALTGKPLEIQNVRGARRLPQHCLPSGPTSGRAAGAVELLAGGLLPVRRRRAGAEGPPADPLVFEEREKLRSGDIPSPAGAP